MPSIQFAKLDTNIENFNNLISIAANKQYKWMNQALFFILTMLIELINCKLDELKKLYDMIKL